MHGTTIKKNQEIMLLQVLFYEMWRAVCYKSLHMDELAAYIIQPQN